jgi:hypothetical protein
MGPILSQAEPRSDTKASFTFTLAQSEYIKIPVSGTTEADSNQRG